MPSSLEKLAQNLPRSKFNHLKQYFQNTEQQNILFRKGVFPYEYIKSFATLTEQQLQSKEKFYSQLNDSHISNEDYEHAQNIWKVFNCETIQDYLDIYLRTDVFFLADILDSFRDSCYQTYGLDPAHYYTSPGLSWDAMLKSTCVELELFTDYDMLNMIQNSI